MKLFDDEQPTADPSGYGLRLARHDDPATSQQAARDTRTQSAAAHQCDIIDRAIANHPGLCTADLAKHCELDRFTIAKRVSVLEKQGRARRGRVVVSKVTGRPGESWWPAP